MLRIVVVVSLATFAAANNDFRCDAKALGSSTADFLRLGTRMACICQDKGDCNPMKVRINGKTVNTSAGYLGEWQVQVEDDHFRVIKSPHDVDAKIYTVSGKGYYVYFICTGTSKPLTHYVEFDTVEAAAPEILEEIKSKYDAEVTRSALQGCSALS